MAKVSAAGANAGRATGAGAGRLGVADATPPGTGAVAGTTPTGGGTGADGLPVPPELRAPRERTPPATVPQPPMLRMQA